MKYKFAAIFTLLLCLINSQLFADGLSTSDFNYINDLVGGRAIGLGGAYTAIADDPAGAFYNPAGLVFTVDNQISLSVNSFKSRTSTYKEVVGKNDYEQEVSSFYPSFFGVVQSFGPVKVGFTFVNLNNEILDQDSYFGEKEKLSFANDDKTEYYPATFTMNYNITENTLLAGPSFAIFILDNLSTGLTIYGMNRSKQEIANQLITYEKDGSTYYSITNTYITEEVYAIKPIWGIQYMPNKYWAIGFSVMPGFVISHKRDVQVFTKSDSAGQDMSALDNNDKPVASFDTSSSEFNDSKIPTQLRVGIAFFPSNKFLVSADLIGHIGDKNLQNDSETTINGAIGTEYYITDSFPIRLGVFTNFANTPTISSSKTNQEAHTNMLGCSSSLSWQTKNSSITIAGFYQTSTPFGDGEAQVYSNKTSVQTVEVSLYSISLTGSAKY